MDIQIENVRASFRLGIITFEEAFEMFRFIRTGDIRIRERIRRQREDIKHSSALQ